MTCSNKTDGHALTELFRYFVPLALQSASQGITYPLVATVASRGLGGPVNLAGLAQSNHVMFLIGTLGSGLVTIGMVYGRTAEGFVKFRFVNNTIALATIGLQSLCALTSLSHFIFGTLLGLPFSIEHPARQTFLFCIPLQFLFFLRNPYQVALYNNRATGRASAATIGRILFTLFLALLFNTLGIVGSFWAVVCLTIPVVFEVLASMFFARPFIKKLESGICPAPSLGELYIFNFTLSIAYVFLSLSGFLNAAFISRAPDPERMLPVYYLAIGVVNPMALAATRLQNVVISFYTPLIRQENLLRFSIISGLILGILPVVFLIPGLSRVYYIHFQKLAAADLPLIRETALVLIVLPLSVALRAQSEGMAAVLKKPVTVLAGQGVFLGTVTTTAFALLSTGVPGNLLGAISVVMGNLASTSTVRLSLHLEKEKQIPVPETRLSQTEQ